MSGASDDPRHFQISLPVQPGNSGGALVDEHGNVVGIVSGVTADCALSFDRAMKFDYHCCIDALAAGGVGTALDRWAT